MPGPFDSKVFDAAFDPFFSDLVAFAATRTDGTHRGTVRACIFDEGYAEPLDETSTCSKVARIALHIRKWDWSACISTDPAPGDRFKSPETGRVYAAATVSHFSEDTWSIEAREVAED